MRISVGPNQKFLNSNIENVVMSLEKVYRPCNPTWFECDVPKVFYYPCDPSRLKWGLVWILTKGIEYKSWECNYILRKNLMAFMVFSCVIFTCTYKYAMCARITCSKYFTVKWREKRKEGRVWIPCAVHNEHVLVITVHVWFYHFWPFLPAFVSIM